MREAPAGKLLQPWGNLSLLVQPDPKSRAHVIPIHVLCDHAVAAGKIGYLVGVGARCDLVPSEPYVGVLAVPGRTLQVALKDATKPEGRTLL